MLCFWLMKAFFMSEGSEGMKKGIKYNQDQSSIMLLLELNFRHNAVVLRVTLKSIMLKFSSIMYLTQSPESRVQSPESRVQSPESRVQSPAQVLAYATRHEPRTTPACTQSGIWSRDDRIEIVSYTTRPSCLYQNIESDWKSIEGDLK